MPGKSVIALTSYKRNVVRLSFSERGVMREVNAGESEISAANPARNLVDVGDLGGSCRQHEGISFGESYCDTLSAGSWRPCNGVGV